MAFATLSRAQAASINLARQHGDDDTRRMVKKEIFAAAKTAYGIPQTTKLKCETADTTHDDYLDIKDSTTNAPFALSPVTGMWVGTVPVPTVAKRWFEISADQLTEAISEYMDNEYFELVSHPNVDSYLPTDCTFTHNLAFQHSTGNAYILLPADHFDN